MADREPMIVIKKITVNPAGGHGGAWKVAFADFMTALMAFFLVMWLLSQSDEVKKNVADYFSTPSIIEYNFSNYGVELTLEKLFLDLINEPLKFFQTFIKPVDYTPNIMAMGSKKVVMHHLADQLSDHAQNVEVYGDEVVFEIDANELFFVGSSKPNSNFVVIMDKVKNLTAGLEESDVYVDSMIFKESVEDRDAGHARSVAEQRLELVSKKIEVGLEHDTVDVYAKAIVKKYPGPLRPGAQPPGSFKFRIRQKTFENGKSKNRKMEVLFGKGDENMDVYNSFVKKLTEQTNKK